MAGPQDYAATAAAVAKANAAAKKTQTPAPKLTAAQTKAINQANALIAKNQESIAKLEGVQNPTPAVDGQAALNKLTGGQTLTDAEKQYLNLAPAPAPTGGSTSTVTSFPPAGPAGSEASPDGKTTRQKFNDGQGGYFYGDWYPNPNYQDPSNTSTNNTNVDVLKAVLRSKGMPASVVDASSSFLTKLLVDLDGDYDNASEVFLNMKDYTLKDGTKISSPFYESYGYLNDGLVNPKTPAELYNFVEGAKGVKDKYGISDTYLTQESLKQYVKNGITVEDMDARANLARLKSVEADPSYIQAAKDMGYITDATQLTDFFLNPKIGKAALTQNAGVVGIAAEAVRRSSLGIKEDKTRFEQLSAGMTAQGYSPEQIQATASTAFQTIGEELNPTVKLAGIYDKTAQTDANTASIQSELEQESFNKLDSERRKRLKAQEIASFSAQSGISNYGLSTGGGLGQSY